MKKLAILTAFIFGISLSGFSQETKSLSLIDALTQQSITLDSQLKGKGLVLIFHSLKCPFATMYDGRIKSLQSVYQSQGFDFILVNPESGKSTEDSQALKMYLEKTGFNMPYLLDELQVWTKYFNVTKIPEVLILTDTGSGVEVWFRGAIDNNPQAESSVSEKFLENALQQVLKGEKPNPSQVRSMGCNIRVF
jgi:hypothetical protein